MTIRHLLSLWVCKMKGNKCGRGLLTLVLSTVVMIMLSVPLYADVNVQDLEMGTHDYIMDKQQTSNCSMVQMSDNELSDVTAAGFSSFSWDDSVATAYLNIQTSTFTEIQSLKMGYYNNGWDEDWTNVSLGSSTQDLVCKGFTIQASFSNLTDPTTRTLDSLRVGTPSMTGPITATFNSFTGRIDNSGTLVLDAVRQNLGRQTINSTDSQFYMQLSTTGPQTGWYFYWSKATITPAP
jgi:hypothetical protein